MMKLRYTTPNGRICFEVDVTGTKDAFEQMADITDVFEQEKCGQCGGTALKCSIRRPKNKQGKVVKYFEFVCQSCNARLDVHQNAPPAESLYITRKDEDGNVKGVNGWYHWTTPDQQQREGDQRQRHHEQRQQTPPKPLTGEAELKGYWASWQAFLSSREMTLENLERFVREKFPLCPTKERPELWNSVLGFAKDMGFLWNKLDQRFVPLNPDADTPY